MALARRRTAAPERMSEPHSAFSPLLSNLPRIEDGLSEGGGGVAPLQDDLLGDAGHFGGFHDRAAFLQLGDDGACLPVEFHSGYHARGRVATSVLLARSMDEGQATKNNGPSSEVEKTPFLTLGVSLGDTLSPRFSQRSENQNGGA